MSFCRFFIYDLSIYYLSIPSDALLLKKETAVMAARKDAVRARRLRAAAPRPLTDKG